MRQLKPDLCSFEITDIRDQLKQKFEAALRHAEFPARIASKMAQMFAHNADKDIQIMTAKHDEAHNAVEDIQIVTAKHEEAHNAVEDIQIVTAKQEDSIVEYFLCKTDKSIYELRQMIVSGFMHSVFATVIESVSPTTVEVNVYITADEVDFRLLCLSSPEDKGWSIAV